MSPLSRITPVTSRTTSILCSVRTVALRGIIWVVRHDRELCVGKKCDRRATRMRPDDPIAPATAARK
jgi:hypothetical protein